MSNGKRPFERSVTVAVPADHRGKSLDDGGAIYDVVEAGLLASPVMTHMELVNLAREVLGEQGSPEDRRVALRKLAGASLRFYWSERERPRFETRIREVFAHPMHATIVKNMGGEFGPDRGSHLNTLIGQILAAFAAHIASEEVSAKGTERVLDEMLVQDASEKLKARIRELEEVRKAGSDRLTEMRKHLIADQAMGGDPGNIRDEDIIAAVTTRTNCLLEIASLVEYKGNIFNGTGVVSAVKKRLEVTQTTLDNMTGAVADQAVQIMELRAEVSAMKAKHEP